MGSGALRRDGGPGGTVEGGGDGEVGALFLPARPPTPPRQGRPAADDADADDGADADADDGHRDPRAGQVSRATALRRRHSDGSECAVNE